MTGSNPNDRSKLGIKRHILTDNNGIPLSVVITPANRHDIKAVTDVIDNAVAKRPVAFLSTTKGRRGSRRRQHQHLCLDRAYNSKSTKQAIIKRGYVPPHTIQEKQGLEKRGSIPKEMSFCKKQAMGCRENKLMAQQAQETVTRYEKKAENYLGLVQFSCSIIIYRKIILGYALIRY